MVPRMQATRTMRLVASSRSPGRVKFTARERLSWETVLALNRVQRALDVVDAVDVVEPAHDVLHGRGDLRIIGLDRALALDENLLGGPLGETGAPPSYGMAL